MGFVSNGALSTLILAQPYFNWLVPDDWSLEDAATVPCVYGTVIYGLVMVNIFVLFILSYKNLILFLFFFKT